MGRTILEPLALGAKGGGNAFVAAPPARGGGANRDEGEGACPCVWHRRLFGSSPERAPGRQRNGDARLAPRVGAFALADGERLDGLGGIDQELGVVTALDPDHGGEIVWQKRVGAGGKIGGVQWGIAVERPTLEFCDDFSVGSRLSPQFPPGGFLLPRRHHSLVGLLAVLDLAAGDDFTRGISKVPTGKAAPCGPGSVARPPSARSLPGTASERRAMQQPTAIQRSRLPPRSRTARPAAAHRAPPAFRAESSSLQ